MADHLDRQSRLSQYLRHRKKFAFRVYLLAILFGLISLLLWLLMVLLDDFGEAMLNYFYISIIGLFVALLIITIFIFFESLRFLTPLNWIMSFLIVISISFGLSCIVVRAEAALFGVCFGIALAVTIIFILIGVLIAHDLTLDVVILFVCSIIFFIGSVLFVMLYILALSSYSFYIFATFVIITTLMFLMYHAQTINGGRYAEMRLTDYLLAALIIYHDFVVLLVMSFYLVSMAIGQDTFNNSLAGHNSTGSGNNTTTEAPPTAAPPSS